MHRTPIDLTRETRRSAFILALSALALGGVAAALPWLRKPARDNKTTCLAGPLSRKTLILVDRTDAWAPSTASLLAASLTRIAEDAPTEERLLLLTFDGNASALPQPLFDKCKPPTSANVIVETPQHIARLHAEQFTAPLLKVLEGLAIPSSAPRTELVQMLAMLATKAHLDVPARATTLHVFSDMEENSAVFSFTKKPAQPLDLFAAHFAATVGERLKHVALHIHVMPPANGSMRADPRIERAWRASLSRHFINFTWGVL